MVTHGCGATFSQDGWNLRTFYTFCGFFWPINIFDRKPVCGASFKARKYLKDHMVIHSSQHYTFRYEAKQFSSLIIFMGYNTKQIHCNVFSSQGSLDSARSMNPWAKLVSLNIRKYFCKDSWKRMEFLLLFIYSIFIPQILAWTFFSIFSRLVHFF